MRFPGRKTRAAILRKKAAVERIQLPEIARMLERWSVPTPDEAHEVEYAVDGAGRGGGWPP